MKKKNKGKLKPKTKKQPFNEHDVKIVKTLMKKAGPKFAKRSLSRFNPVYMKIYDHLLKTEEWKD